MGGIGAHCEVEDELAVAMGIARVVMLEVWGIDWV